MRIGLLTYGDMANISGGYLYNRKLVDYLCRQGDQVEIISLPPRSYWRSLGDNFDPSCWRKIATASVEILIEDAMVHPSVALQNRRISRQLNIPIISLVHLLNSFDHQPWYSAWFKRAVERRYLKSVSGIIANSQTTQAQLQQLLDHRLPPYCIAVPAADHFDAVNMTPSELQQRAQAPGPLKILLVGNVIRRKGLHVLIRALGQLADENFRVTVAGRLDMEPDYVATLKQQIRDLRLQGEIVFKGVVESSALPELYRQHQLMVLPSAYESYGIVYLEAQQFGLPVIGTTAGAAHEIVGHGENGYLIEPENHRLLAGYLHILQNDRQLLTRLSRNALVAYARHPKWEDSCGIIRQFLYARIDAE
jgi:glycosyltransferase involved in cell wall biosynthesis